jgi:hypothetical protein
MGLYLKHEGNYCSFKMSLFYITALKCLSKSYTGMTVHYTLLADEFDVVFMLMEYLHAFFCAALFYYFTKELSNLLNPSSVKRYLGLVLLSVLIAFLIGTCIYFIVQQFRTDNVYHCTNSFWLGMRSSEVVMGFIFLYICIRLTQQLNAMRKVSNIIVKNSRENEVWCLIITVLTGDILSFVINLYQILVIAEDGDCVEYIEGAESANIVIFILSRILTEYINIIVFLYIFWVSRFRIEEGRRSLVESPIDSFEGKLPNRSWQNSYQDTISKSSFIN